MPGGMESQGNWAGFDDDEPLPAGVGHDESIQQPEEEVHSAGVLSLSTKVEYTSLANETSHTVFGLVNVVSKKDEPGSSVGAAEASAAERTTPVDVVCVLDVSGSMQSGGKINLLKEAQRFVIDEMRSEDRLSIVSFNSSAERVTPLQRMSPEGKDGAKVATMRLTAGGGTSIYSGLDCTLAMMEQRRQRNSVSAIFLLTDGQDHTTRHHVKELVQRCRQAGVALYTFGFGADHDTALLSSLAEAAQTPFTYVDDPATIKAAFAGAISGLMSVVAKNVDVKIECKGGALLEKAHTSFTVTGMSSGGCTVRIPDMFAGEKRDILVELKVPQLLEGSGHSVEQVLSVSARYRDLLQEAVVQTPSVVMEMDRQPAEQQPEMEPDVEVLEQRQRVEVTAALEQAIGHCATGDFVKAQEVLTGTKSRVQHHKTKMNRASPTTDALVAELEDAEGQMSSSSTFNRGGHAEMTDALLMHKHQRCTNVSASVGGRTKSSKAMYIQTQQMACISKSSGN